MLTLLLLFSALLLAYSNGSNDNFKGVATLYGSRTVNYRTAIWLATVATFAGSITAIFVAQGLISSFSGKGLVPQNAAGMPDFLTAVGLGAAFNVLVAARLGMPVSTTHSLVGGLLGAGLMAVGSEVNVERLTNVFLLPIIVSPFIAFALCAVVYWLFNRGRLKLGLTKESYIFIGEQKKFVPLKLADANRIAAMESSNPSELTIALADSDDCVEMYSDHAWGISLQKLLDFAHVISGFMVSFARGLNDTPKIAGLLVAVHTIDIKWGMIAIAVGIALGGLLNARRVAETMSNKITSLSHGQGFSANLVTAFLVIVASKFGVPVSTTHVSVGAIFGISLVSDSHNNQMIKSIILSWIVTVPVAMSVSAFAYFVIS